MFSLSRKYIYIALFIIAIIGLIHHISFKNNHNQIINGNQQHTLNLSLFPNDHLDGIKLEIDGDVNMDYLREILFGIDHHLISLSNKNLAVKIIKKLFYSNDLNHDKFLDQDEVFELISKNIKSHFEKAKKVNHEAVKQLENPKTHLISWENYVAKYLQLNNRKSSFIELYFKKFDEYLLSNQEREFLYNARRHWSNADLNDDNHLNETEYLGFLHPELNMVSLNRMCDKIMMNLDRDMNGQLTEMEFIDKNHQIQIVIVTPYPGYVISDQDKDIKPDNDEIRKMQFREQIDTNKDGIADRKELLEYINPRNRINIYKDSMDIIKTIDENNDRKLTLNEMMRNYQNVINSKLVNIAAVFHNDDL